MQVTSRWEELFTGRGGGKHVKNERYLRMNVFIWRGGRKEGETNGPENGRRKRWGERARLKCNKK